MSDMVTCIINANFNDIVKIVTDMDLSQVIDVIQEAQRNLHSNGPAWSSWS